MNVKKCTATNATIVIMKTEIISLVLLVLMVIVMYFVMKIYSILRAHECSFHPVHDIEMDAATKRTELHGGVAPRQRQTIILMTEKYEKTSRVPQEHDERNKEVSKFKSVKTLNSVKFKPRKLSRPGQDLTLTNLNNSCFPVAFKF